MHAISMMRCPASGSRPVVSVSSTILLIVLPDDRETSPLCGRVDRGASLVGERVRALVAFVSRVALHPHPLDLVAAHDLVEPLPEVGVLHRILRRRAPAA